ncbi:MAG: glycosyltransferase family 4 protein [Paludibacteraceae bacterium]|nr:glycosyltransferase family 4 protein [Paludibacteraceae bacterium]
MKRRIAILQPEIPHFRDEFFFGLKRDYECDVYVYNTLEQSRKHGYCIHEGLAQHLANLHCGGFMLCNPFPLLRKKYDVLVLMLHPGHLMTWLLLLTKRLHRKKIILWGQGISVKRYLTEDVRPDRKLKGMIALSDGVWVYMDKQAEQWKILFPKKSIISLNNTISGVEKILSYVPLCSKKDLKQRYGMTESRILLFCARFDNPYRRVDLLMSVIERVEADDVGVVIIGQGQNKPDFSGYLHVYDMGQVYDENMKRDLFTLADIYIQPGWVGLSVVEAMAYGLPVYTFKRSEDVVQCVEYDYIIHGETGLIFDNMEDAVAAIVQITEQELRKMGQAAKDYVGRKATMRQMIERAEWVIEQV